ncbi:MAG: CtsR family transcriptional regulator [Clostridia bacterium]|nr:CtsR family transcriptional regulator [Clostridia bacterium]
MGMSDRIEAFILQLLSDEDEWIELKRNELASVFDCVPSQINYVISTRFAPSNGYLTESRRGGGGYLRIKRIKSQNGLTEFISGIGDSIDAVGAAGLLSTLAASDLISEAECQLILTAVSDKSLIINQPYKNRVRAEILKNTLSKICERTV